jgi:RNA-binding protein 39
MTSLQADEQARNVSGDTHRTRRSHRSRSRDRDRDRERRRHHDSRRDSRDGLHRDRDKEHHHRHRSREPSDRDRHRHRDRHADRDRDRDGTRARDKDDRDRKDRRRGRDEDLEDEAYRERAKRRREEDGSLRGDPSPQNQGGSKRESHGPIDRSPSILGRTTRSGDDELRNRSPGLEDPLDRPINRRPSPRRYVVTFGMRSCESECLICSEKRQSPTYEPPSAIADGEPEHRQEDDSEARSVFVSQLAARLTARDLGYFFEDKLGEGSVRDCRIVTDRISRRSKGCDNNLVLLTSLLTFLRIAYVEFRSIDLVPKAIALSGTIVMGLPIMIQLTEAERNRTHAADMFGVYISPLRALTMPQDPFGE